MELSITSLIILTIAALVTSIISGMTGMAGAVEEGLRERGIADVPVIDPALLAFKMAEALAGMGLSHSKRTYPTPPKKEIIGF